MTAPSIWFSVFLALALVGVLCWALVQFSWPRVQDVFANTWTARLGKAIKGLAAVVAVVGAYTADPATKGEWLPAVLAGAVCVVVWEIVEETAKAWEKCTETATRAHEKQAAEEALAASNEASGRLREDLAVANDKSNSLMRLLGAFRTRVDRKVSRARKILGRASGKSQRKLAERALTPEEHLSELVTLCATFFQEQLPPGEGQNHNFRVGIYGERDGVMVPVVAVSLNDGDYDPFTSHKKNEAAFRLDAAEPTAVVVRCVLHRDLVVVEDCPATAATRPEEFSYFDDRQRNYLRSIVAFYIGKVDGPRGIMRAALVVDTDAAGFFKPADRAWLKFVLWEFGKRIQLEMLLHVLFSGGGETDGRKHHGRKATQTGRTTPQAPHPGRPGDAEERRAAQADPPGQENDSDGELSD